MRGQHRGVSKRPRERVEVTRESPIPPRSGPGERAERCCACDVMEGTCSRPKGELADAGNATDVSSTEGNDPGSKAEHPRLRPPSRIDNVAEAVDLALLYVSIHKYVVIVVDQELGLG